MTVESLERLVEEATPGPWQIESEGDTFWLFFPGKEEGPDEADARLAALAPDLARIVIEQHRALERIAQAPITGAPEYPIEQWRADVEVVQFALALLDGLGEA